MISKVEALKGRLLAEIRLGRLAAGAAQEWLRPRHRAAAGPWQVRIEPEFIIG